MCTMIQLHGVWAVAIQTTRGFPFLNRRNKRQAMELDHGSTIFLSANPGVKTWEWLTDIPYWESNNKEWTYPYDWGGCPWEYKPTANIAIMIHVHVSLIFFIYPIILLIIIPNIYSWYFFQYCSHDIPNIFRWDY